MSVHAGSVNVEVEIVDNRPPVNGAVTSVESTLGALIAAGSLDVGYEINNATVAVSDSTSGGALHACPLFVRCFPWCVVMFAI